MKIYIVMQCFPYETDIFEGAYSTLELAEARRLEFEDPDGYSYVYIIETELDNFFYTSISIYDLGKYLRTDKISNTTYYYNK